ncbi:MAG: hypothetical protein JWS10_3773 [Cypionkella sp.]|nr:hypothetical protein [Cypionkella sp.]
MGEKLKTCAFNSIARMALADVASVMHIQLLLVAVQRRGSIDPYLFFCETCQRCMSASRRVRRLELWKQLFSPGHSTGAFVWRSVAAPLLGQDQMRLEPSPSSSSSSSSSSKMIGVDGCCEARIVRLQAQICAALVRCLRPGGADLNSADQDPVGGSVLAQGAGRAVKKRCPERLA